MRLQGCVTMIAKDLAAWVQRQSFAAVTGGHRPGRQPFVERPAGE
jgi:hypothetical protein